MNLKTENFPIFDSLESKVSNPDPDKCEKAGSSLLEVRFDTSIFVLNIYYNWAGREPVGSEERTERSRSLQSGASLGLHTTNPGLTPTMYPGVGLRQDGISSCKMIEGDIFVPTSNIVAADFPTLFLQYSSIYISLPLI